MGRLEELRQRAEKAEARRVGMEEAAQACRDEQVSSESHPGDIAYNQACRDCEAAIRAAIDKGSE